MGFLLRHGWLLALALVACTGPEPARDEQVELQNRIVELEQENARLGARIHELESTVLCLASDGQEIACPPPIDAHVLTIHPDRNRVLLDKGSRDGVAIGFVFTVYLGSTYKGLVRVTEVDETTSFAEITGQKNPIASGDAATIYL